MHAPSQNGGDPARTVPGSGLLPPLPIPFNQKIAKQGQVQVNEVMDALKRQKAGKPYVDPLQWPRQIYVQKMKKLGLKVLPSGKVVEQKAAAP